MKKWRAAYSVIVVNLALLPWTVAGGARVGNLTEREMRSLVREWQAPLRILWPQHVERALRGR